MKHWTELIFGEVFEKANHDKRKKGGDEWKHWFLDLLKVWKKISKDFQNSLNSGSCLKQLQPESKIHSAYFRLKFGW